MAGTGVFASRRVHRLYRWGASILCRAGHRLRILTGRETARPHSLRRQTRRSLAADGWHTVMLRAGIIALVLVVAPCPAAAGHDKTDVATTDDGSIYVGEIKSVQYATLTLNTNAAGLIDLEWRYVTGLTSKFEYRVELSAGGRLLGRLGPPEEAGNLSIPRPGIRSAAHRRGRLGGTSERRGDTRSRVPAVQAELSLTERGCGKQRSIAGDLDRLHVLKPGGR